MKKKEEKVKEEEKEEKKQEKKESKKSKKKINKKLILKIAITVAIVAIVVFLFISFGLPLIHYSNGNSKYNSKDYKNAIKSFEKLDINYKDVRTKLNSAYVEYGKELVEKNDYSEGNKYLNKANVEETDNHLKYSNALVAIDNGEYSTAISTLKDLKDFLNSEKELQRAYYLYAEKLFSEKSYSSAKENYENAGDYEDAKEKINAGDILTAEEYFKNGELYKAKQIFSKLPSDYTYNDIKVSDRLNTLNQYNAFVELSRNWKGKGKMEVRHIYREDKSWESWYGNYVGYASFKCVIQDDGSVKVTGTADFYSYTNYSSVNYLVNSKDVEVPISFTVKKGGKIPSKLVSGYPALIAPSGKVGKAKITYSSKEIKLNFELYDKEYSAYFSNKYTSKITYKKQ